MRPKLSIKIYWLKIGPVSSSTILSEKRVARHSIERGHIRWPKCTAGSQKRQQKTNDNLEQHTGKKKEKTRKLS